MCIRDRYEALYPPRSLPEGARVTRIAPSPTGFLHLGVFFTAMVNRLAADTSNGIFYFRLEDTDKKREIAGGAEDILRGLADFGLTIDEGFVAPGEGRGVYGPYRQSERAPIYHTYAKKLVLEGLAYPCFCTPDRLAEVRKRQEADKMCIRDRACPFQSPGFFLYSLTSGQKPREGARALIRANQACWSSSGSYASR